MTKLTFPYTMHCMFCKVGIKVKNKAMIGKMINCPKCNKRIEVITPDQDGHVPYTVSAAPEEEPEEEPTEEELEQRDLERRLVKRKDTITKTKHWMTIFWYLVLLGAAAGIFYKFVILAKREKAATEQNVRAPLQVGPGAHVALLQWPGRVER